MKVKCFLTENMGMGNNYEKDRTEKEKLIKDSRYSRRTSFKMWIVLFQMVLTNIWNKRLTEVDVESTHRVGNKIKTKQQKLNQLLLNLCSTILDGGFY